MAVVVCCVEKSQLYNYYQTITIIASLASNLGTEEISPARSTEKWSPSLRISTPSLLDLKNSPIPPNRSGTENRDSQLEKHRKRATEKHETQEKHEKR